MDITGENPEISMLFFYVIEEISILTGVLIKIINFFLTYNV